MSDATDPNPASDADADAKAAMLPHVADLVDLLKLEQFEHNLFRGRSNDVGSDHVFGGQVLGQALMAASRTVTAEPQHSVHSLHGYFLRAGDKDAPIVYDVDRIRDGKSFTTRRVVAIQHGKPIFHMSASFHVRESGVEHQTQMPEVPPPESLMPDHELRRSMSARFPARRIKFLERDTPIDFRSVTPVDPITPEVHEPHNIMWMRTAGALSDDPVLHHALLAYASDFSLLRVAMFPHRLSFMQPNIHGASLDHAMWFHRDFRFDDWLLYDAESPSMQGSRGFCRGNIFSRDGRLIASVAQEGLIRVHGA
ncbi:MAG: Palmitoyl-CoA hydrolase [Rhizobacter sp.]|nr:Palmitoyl-CoA hydrolase [Rhizobacter sp.]